MVVAATPPITHSPLQQQLRAPAAAAAATSSSKRM
jgi:hypothetical protein